jgi:hypothetical protein
METLYLMVLRRDDRVQSQPTGVLVNVKGYAFGLVLPFKCWVFAEN